MSNNILFWYKCEDLQCIDLFGINQNVAQKYSPNCAIQFSKFKNLPASEGGSSLWGGHIPPQTPPCARNWRWRATRSSPPSNVQNGSTPLSVMWGLRTDICLWKGGLVSGKFLNLKKFPNLGACELKISKFGGLWAKIWVKIEAVEAKISKFSQKGVLWTDSFA